MLTRVHARAVAVPPAVLLLLAGLILAGAAACGPAGEADATVRVVAGFYPLQYVAEQVGGDRVSVTNLVEPGAEPHDLELSPRQLADVADARLVVYLAGFQPAVDSAVELEAADSAFDVASVVPMLGNDPHVWLDPTRLATVATALADRLATIDPAGAATYAARAQELRTRLMTLDQAYADGLRTCQRREIVVSHSAFGYLADRYELVQVSIAGLSPESEPTPQRLADVASAARTYQATTIFFETLVSPKVAQAIATEVGASTAVLDPIEGLQAGAGGDYVSVMLTNLATLKLALGCA